MTPLIEGLLAALGVGLLIGLMRERRRNDPDSGPSAAGLRTHALAAVATAVAWHLDIRVFLLVFAIGGVLIAMSYRRTAESDVGLTGEFALVITMLLGAVAMGSTGIAAGIGVVCATLLHLRSELHHLGREVISEQEVHDGLLLAAAALVILPLLPTEPVDPWSAIVPASLWKLVVLVMAAGVAGQVALRAVGVRYGLPASGFFAGFASSTAATVSYGHRAKEDPRLAPYAASAAVLANVATLILLAAVLATASPSLLAVTAVPIAVAVLALVSVALLGLFSQRNGSPDIPREALPKSFKLSHALALAAFVAVVLVVSAVLTDIVGERAALAATALAGLVDLQGAALAVSQLAERGRVTMDVAQWGIVALLAASSALKAGLAVASGGRAYGLRVGAALGAAVTAAAVAAWFVTP